MNFESKFTKFFETKSQKNLTSVKNPSILNTIRAAGELAVPCTCNPLQQGW